MQDEPGDCLMRPTCLSPKAAAKLQFIHRALVNGWSVRKKEDTYVFRRKHNGETRVFQKSFAHSFVRENSDVNLGAS